MTVSLRYPHRSFRGGCHGINHRVTPWIEVVCTFETVTGGVVSFQIVKLKDDCFW